MESYLPRGVLNILKILIGCAILLFLFTCANHFVYSGYKSYAREWISGGIGDAEGLSGKRKLHTYIYGSENNTGTAKEHEIEVDLRNVKILCWVLTMPANHDLKAIHVKNTWGKRCDKLIFMSSVNNESLPSINLGYKDSRNYLWGKTKKAFQYIYKHHLNEYGWFLKADDDTYVILENLRYFLSIYDPDEDAIWFGSRFKKFSVKGYMSGGAGYVLSRSAVKALVEKAIPNPSLCKAKDTGNEDVEIGKCLNNTGVMAGDTRDNQSRGKFFPLEPIDHLIPGEIGPDMWYWEYVYYPSVNGKNCCSDLAISFHYLEPKMMYVLDYLIYQLHPFGIKYSDTYPPPPPLDKNSTPTRILQKYNGNLSQAAVG